MWKGYHGFISLLLLIDFLSSVVTSVFLLLHTLPVSDFTLSVYKTTLASWCIRRLLYIRCIFKLLLITETSWLKGKSYFLFYFFQKTGSFSSFHYKDTWVLTSGAPYSMTHNAMARWPTDHSIDAWFSQILLLSWKMTSELGSALFMVHIYSNKIFIPFFQIHQDALKALKIAVGVYVISAGPPNKQRFLDHGIWHPFNNTGLSYILQEPKCNILIFRRKKRQILFYFYLISSYSHPL